MNARYTRTLRSECVMTYMISMPYQIMTTSQRYFLSWISLWTHKLAADDTYNMDSKLGQTLATNAFALAGMVIGSYVVSAVWSDKS